MTNDNLEQLQDTCFKKAHMMMGMGLSQDMDIFELTDLLVQIELEKEEKQRLSDEKIEFNDEIIEIEEVGELETIDISVTGNQLFYCNDILTKNSMGITHTADAIFALITSEDLESRGQLMIKQLKNRWGDLGYYRRFVVGIDRSRMKLYDLEDSAQSDIQNEIHQNSGAPKTSEDYGASVFDKTSFGKSVNDKRKRLFETEGDLI